jgi:U3 small nucleolar RNA-associated protein 14
LGKEDSPNFFFLRKRSELNHNAEDLGSQETKYSNNQKVLSESRVLSQEFNKENHQSRKQNMRTGTVFQVQREELGALEEKKHLLLKRPETVQILEELEEVGKEECSQNKELAEPV